MKRKWICLLIIVCVLTGIFPFQRVMADEERFEISCSLKDTFYISGNTRSYPVYVTIKNNGEDFSGTLKILLYTGSDTEDTIAYGQPAVIAAGETAVFVFNIHSTLLYSEQTYHVPLRADMLDENGNTVYQTVSAFLANALEYAVINAGIVSDNSQICQNLNESYYDYEGIMASGTVNMYGENMTSDMIDQTELSRLQLMIIDAPLSDEAWQYVSEWVIGGGHLLIEGSLYDEWLTKPLDENNITEWGTGRILAFDSSELEGAALMRTVLKLFGDDGIEDLLVGSYDSYWYIDQRLSYDTLSISPSFMPYLIVFVIYILTVGPGAYLILRKKDRREYLWAVIPAVSVVFFIIVYCIGSETRYDTPFIRYCSEVWLTDEGTVEKTKLAVVTPDQGQIMFSIDNDYEIMPIWSDYYWNLDDGQLAERQLKLSDQIYHMALAYSEDKTDVLINSRSMFEENYLSISRIVPNNGMIDTDLTYSRGRFSGTITNSTPWNLEHVFLMHQGLLLMIGDLPSGESIELSQESPTQLINFYQDIQLEIDEEDEEDGVADDYQQISMADTLKENSGTLICGFTKEYTIGVSGGSQVEPVAGQTMIIKNVEIAEIMDGLKTQALIYGTGLTSEDRDYCNNYDHSFYSQEMALIYQLDTDYDPDYLEWINADEILELSFYNFKTGNYERVMTDDTVMEGASLQNYLSQKNVLRVKVKVTEMDVECYIPAFTMTGGVKK